MKILLILIFSIISFTVNASCRCSCVNGQMQNLCDNSFDVQTPCVGICPITTPSVAPVMAPTVPAVGTSSCQMKQVYNNLTGSYEWKNICE